MTDSVSELAKAYLAMQEAVLQDDLGVRTLREGRSIEAVACAIAVETDDPLKKLQAFQVCVFGGMVPPPELLIAVAESFARYTAADGAITLDRAMGLKPKQRRGHPVKHRQKELEIFQRCTMLHGRLPKDGGRLAVLHAWQKLPLALRKLWKFDKAEKDYRGWKRQWR
jgi:hypothetical protein